ncbi:MAG: hypothetical protein IID18_00880, partial [Nitrospinae bacterium]|nr:hypothetical protein [Nitrospinota bacterium]
MRMKSALSITLLISLFVPLLSAAELTPEVLIEGVQGNPEAFELVKIDQSDQVVSFDLELGETTATVAGEFVFDGFQFVVPADAKGKDLVWYFNAPTEWGNWYIIPVEGKPGDGFRGWLNGDKIYQTFDVSREKKRVRILQTLSGENLKPGKSYILWFRRVLGSSGGKLRGCISFVKKSEDWDYESIEKVLGLKPGDVAAQVAQLDSKGGRILLERAFFQPSYAENRIEAVFFSLRNTKRMRGGMFITIETDIPICKTEPSYAAILGKFGEADFIQSGKELARLRKSWTDEADDSVDQSVTTYYYDYFGFEVQGEKGKEVVTRVVSSANDYSVLKAGKSELSFGQVPMENLTAFQKKGKEVGRMYSFLEGGKKPFIIREPPIGMYKREGQELEYKGKGNWFLTMFSKDGVVAQKIPFTNHQRNGISEWFYPSGKPSFIVPYKGWPTGGGS